MFARVVLSIACFLGFLVAIGLGLALRDTLMALPH